VGIPLNLLRDLRVGQTVANWRDLDRPSVARPTTCALRPTFEATRKFLVKNAVLASGQFFGRYRQILEGFSALVRV